MGGTIRFPKEVALSALTILAGNGAFPSGSILGVWSDFFPLLRG